MRRRLASLMHRGTAGVLRSIGIGARAATDMAGDLLAHSGRLSLAIVASIVAPLSEVLFIAALYAMVDPDQRAEVSSRVYTLGVDRVVVSLPGADPVFVLLVLGAVVSLLVTVLAKYTFGFFHSHFLLTTYVIQARRVVAAYLFASPAQAARLDRGHVANATIGEATQYGRVVFSLLEASSNAVAVLIFLAAAMTMAPGLMAAAAALGAVTMLITRRGYARQKRIGSRRVEVQSMLMSGLWDILNSYTTLKVEGGERRLLARFTDDLESKQAWRLDKTHADLFTKLGSEATLYIALLAVILLATLVLRIEPSLILVFLVVMGRLQKYLGSVQQGWIDVQHALPSLESTSDLLDFCGAGAVAPPADLHPHPRPASYSLTFAGVSFAYDGVRILEDLNLELQPGDGVLIQGASGQGKSTLLYLAAGLLRPRAGRVAVNGEPLTEDAFYRLRAWSSYVAPNLHLFRGSIRENLSLSTDYTDAELRAALARAHLDELVGRLPGGLDGDIGDNGANLSLGERQRVMLARIFVKNPLLILLDEATANLDLTNERTILEALFQQIDPRAIVLMVTHRAPIGLDFTRVLNLVDGRVVQRPVAEAS